MGVDLHWSYYTKECNHPKILPFLSYDLEMWASGRLSTDFYNMCRRLAKYDEDNECYIFNDIEKLFEFASYPETPVSISDYITETEYLDYPDIKHEPDDIFILWIR